MERPTRQFTEIRLSWTLFKKGKLIDFTTIVSQASTRQPCKTVLLLFEL